MPAPNIQHYHPHTIEAQPTFQPEAAVKFLLEQLGTIKQHCDVSLLTLRLLAAHQTAIQQKGRGLTKREIFRFLIHNFEKKH